MISTACYPYPVNDKSTARRVALQPHIYSPPESHTSPRNAMYPYFHSSGSPSPNYIYSGYEQYYSKDSWASAAPSSWSTLYRSSSLAETTVNPKVTILPPQPVLMSDIDTPSSISSHTILTPPSPFTRHDMSEAEFQPMDSFDDFDCDDEEADFIDSDFADEMEGTDETDQEHSLVYGASAPHIIKSTSALEGALGDIPSSTYNTDLDVFAPADRRLSASVPGYPSASHQRLTSSPSIPEPSFPSQHPYTHRNYSSSTPLTSSPSLYNHMSSSSLAGAFTSSVPSHHASRPAHSPLPILQPQPIRPIPPIPLADLTSSANGCTSPEPCPQGSHPCLRTLSPLPLLCQPVSDAVRYQLKESPSSGAADDVCYDEENTSESMCEDLIIAPENHRFTQQGLTFSQEHPSSGGTRSVGEKDVFLWVR